MQAFCKKNVTKSNFHVNLLRKTVFFRTFAPVMKRLASIDILKLFAMFLVIWGHCVQFLLTSHYLDEPAYLYIYSFHMPLFMMISGLFVHRELSSAADLGRQMLIRARQLLLPCLAWGLLMSMGNLIQPLLNGTHVDKTLLSTLYTNFWFLKSLFICFALWYVSLFLLRKRWLAIVVSLVASLFITEWMVQWMYVSFAVGVLLSGHIDSLRQNRKRITIVCLTLGAILLIFWNKQAFLIPSVYRFPELTTPELLSAIGMRLYRYLVNVSLSIGFIALFLGLENLSTFSSQLTTTLNSKHSTLNCLANFGKLTLGVYIIHTMFFIIRNRFFPTLLCCDSLNPWLFNMVIAPLLAAMLLLISLALTKVLTLLPRLSFFFLGTPWPKRQAM